MKRYPIEKNRWKFLINPNFYIFIIKLTYWCLITLCNDFIDDKILHKYDVKKPKKKNKGRHFMRN